MAQELMPTPEHSTDDTPADLPPTTDDVQIGDPLAPIAEDDAEDEYLMNVFMQDLAEIEEDAIHDIDVPLYPIHT